jgi:hypothetical protein
MLSVVIKKKNRMARWAAVAALITLIIVAALALFLYAARDQRESYIIKGGPFDSAFSSLYPQDHAREIEDWFGKTIPQGTNRAGADRILSSSFTISVTDGKETTIDSHSSLAGGYHTKVTLIFDSGGFQKAKVSQHWAYL